MQVTEVASEASGVSQLLLVMPTAAELLARKVAATNLAKQQATAAVQMEKSVNLAMWLEEKMQQCKEQEAARTARLAQAVQEYKDTQQTQDELTSLERAMQTMGLSFEDVSTDAVDRVLKILSTGGYTMKGGRTAQETDTHSKFSGDDRSFIVLTETKFSFRCIPVWDQYSPHRTRVEKKTHVIMLSP